MTENDIAVQARANKINHANRNKIRITDPEADFITPEAIEVALSTFGPRKGPGEDRLPPIGTPMPRKKLNNQNLHSFQDGIPTQALTLSMAECETMLSSKASTRSIQHIKRLETNFTNDSHFQTI